MMLTTATYSKTEKKPTESADDYGRIVSSNGKFRVIVCKGNLQWIVQRRDRSNGGLAGARWRSLRYFRTRAALITFWTGLNRSLESDIPVELDALPKNFRGWCQ